MELQAENRPKKMGTGHGAHFDYDFFITWRVTKNYDFIPPVTDS
ncbi:protein of unknown function [Denitratisoma oestradiolicum]|uniref:Uncharacterized protein n=1 Tax=Denitratisoma oestradiolicum TaxID=311182 RepID=A0A6S6YRJ8_9PROT|nr:protein of unknown function [Denitratisoma oestradiolicum]